MIGFFQGSNLEQSLKYPILTNCSEIHRCTTYIGFNLVSRKTALPGQVFLRAEIWAVFAQYSKYTLGWNLSFCQKKIGKAGKICQICKTCKICKIGKIFRQTLTSTSTEGEITSFRSGLEILENLQIGTRILCRSPLHRRKHDATIPHCHQGVQKA